MKRRGISFEIHQPIIFIKGKEVIGNVNLAIDVLKLGFCIRYDLLGIMDGSNMSEIFRSKFCSVSDLWTNK